MSQLEVDGLQAATAEAKKTRNLVPSQRTLDQSQVT